MKTPVDVREAILSIPGVVTVYAARPLLRAMVGDVAAGLAPGGAEEPADVEIKRRADSTHVLVRIGSDSAFASTAVARAVAAVVRAELAAEAHPVSVNVEVSSVRYAS